MTCPVCSHEQRTDLDVRLAQGVALATLAGQFDLPEAALKRHQADHLRNLPVRLSTNPASVLLDLERVEMEAWGVVEMARGVPSRDEPGKYAMDPTPSLLLAGLAEIRQCKTAQVKLAKELAMFSKNTIPRETFERMTAEILKALQPFPDARAAVEGALAELEL